MIRHHHPGERAGFPPFLRKPQLRRDMAASVPVSKERCTGSTHGSNEVGSAGFGESASAKSGSMRVEGRRHVARSRASLTLLTRRDGRRHTRVIAGKPAPTRRSRDRSRASPLLQEDREIDRGQARSYEKVAQIDRGQARSYEKVAQIDRGQARSYKKIARSIAGKPAPTTHQTNSTPPCCKPARLMFCSFIETSEASTSSSPCVMVPPLPCNSATKLSRVALSGGAPTTLV